MKKIAIVVSGGPAPGINAVIESATIEARSRNIEIVGFQGGFRGLVEQENGSTSPIRSISYREVARIYNLGGSILQTSRFNPLSDPKTRKLFLSKISEAGIEGLIVIGGEGSATLSGLISEQLPDLYIAHVPKTIDNDIPLPAEEKTFGFETARTEGTKILDTLVVDAKTCQRWYLVETMGRQAGFLTLGMSFASGVSLAMIPEEYQDGLSDARDLALRIVETIEKRLLIGKKYGVVLMAEGLLDRLIPQSSEIIDETLRDELGRLTYSEIELGDVLRPLILKELATRGICNIDFKHKNIGYELRCAKPIAADIEYARMLGFGAVESLCKNKGAFMITRLHEKFSFIPLKSFIKEGRITGRTVDLNSDLYRLANRSLSY